jgi:hypothetical protein
VSHVIVDEIHERGVNEDFLLIILKVHPLEPFSSLGACPVAGPTDRQVA